MSAPNQALMILGAVVMLISVIGTVVMPARFGPWQATAIVMVGILAGIGLFMTGVVRSTIEDSTACAAKGGVLVRSVCIERSAVIDQGSQR